MLTAQLKIWEYEPLSLRDHQGSLPAPEEGGREGGREGREHREKISELFLAGGDGEGREFCAVLFIMAFINPL